MANETTFSGGSLSAREEYIARINRVIDYIEAHISDELTLEKIASVAHFSPYHFHRVFYGVMQETLSQFIQRLRIERAAIHLVNMPRKPITEIALDSGFASAATFARAFRQAHGVSASEYRARFAYLETPDERALFNSKMSKARGNLGKAHDSVAGYSGSRTGDASRMLSKDSPRRSVELVKPVEVKVEDMQGFEVAYVRHVGPYQGDGALFESLWGKLMRWAGTRGLMMPETKMLVIYHDNPEVTDSDKLRISVCISVPEGTPVEGEVGKMSIPGGENMFAQFVIGIQEYGAAWAYVFSEWFPSSGYQPDERPSFEMYPQGGCDDPSKHKVTIVVPVMPL